MWTRTIGEDAAGRQAWDTFVASAHGGVLQTASWAAFKQQAGWRPYRLAVGAGDAPAAGAQVLLRALPAGLGSIAYCPRGPLGDWLDGRACDAFWPAIHSALRRQRAIFLKVEPAAPPAGALDERLGSLGFVHTQDHIQPVTTLQVDLSRDVDSIRAAQKPKTRYNAGLAARKGVTIEQGSSADLPAIYPLLEETSRRDGFPIHSLEYYKSLLDNMKDVSRLTIARHEGDVLAAIFVAAFGDEAIYLHGASSSQKRNLMATYLIQWEAMQWAKNRGCRYYDLWGIPETASGDEGEVLEHEGGLWGVYRFKSGFGGALARFAGSYDYVYSPHLYQLWNETLPRYRALLLRRLGMRNDR